jgi:ankyrin repeat protein
MFLSKKIFIYAILACCSAVYVTKAMEQEELSFKRTEEHSAAGIEEKTEEHVSPFGNLTPDLKVYIISFLASASDEKEAIKNITTLSITSKEFHNFIHDPSVLGSLIKEIGKHFGKSLIEIIIARNNSNAFNWLKGYAQHNPEVQETLDQSLLEAVTTKNSKSVQKLLKAGAKVNKVHEFGHNAFSLAARHGLKDIVQFLLDAGTDVNILDGNGCTPLFTAAFNCLKDIVQLLLDAGADVNLADKLGGRAPLLLAVQGRNIDIVELLLNVGAKADVNKADNHGNTPLISATLIGQKDIARLLLNAGADVNQADSNGKTPLYWASSHHHNDIVKLLQKHGAYK